MTQPTFIIAKITGSFESVLIFFYVFLMFVSSKKDAPSDSIPQLDGSSVEQSSDLEVSLSFVSNYAEEDVLEGLKELFEDGTIPCLPSLVSRVLVNPRSADHLCTLKLMLPVSKSTFDWPMIPGFPDFFKDVKWL